MKRATRVHRRHVAAGVSGAAHEAAWDTLASGVVLLDDDGRVLWANQSARQTLTARDALTLQAGRLAAASPGENAALQQLVRAAIATEPGRGLELGGALGVSDRSRTRSLAVPISPLRSEPGFARRPAALVLIRDPERNPEGAATCMQRLYGLSRREAALAALLVQGKSMHDAAVQLGISLHTARTQLRSAFRKTNTRRQSELVGLLARSLPL